ncbi:hypothetical protein AB4Z21_05110 [Paenibacillus sp. MCAF20]
MDKSIHRQEQSEGKARSGPKRSRITMWVILSLLGIFIVGAGSVAYYIWNGLQPTAAGETKRMGWSMTPLSRS